MEQLDLKAVEDHEAELERKRQAQDAAIERERVEQVFGLTGGELEDEPWVVIETSTPSDPNNHTVSGQAQYIFWFEGIPDYLAKRDYPDFYDVSYRTIVQDCSWGLPPEVIEDEDGKWYRVAHFTSSGETACSWEGCEDADEHLPCPLCEGTEEDGHGQIYLGEGWAEVIYKQDPVREVHES